MTLASSDKLKALMAEGRVGLSPQQKPVYISRSSNDNGVVFNESNAADARAYAALALKRSLIHNLVDNCIIDLAQANNIASIANYTTQSDVDHVPRDRPLEHSTFFLSDVKYSSKHSSGCSE